MCTNSDWDTDTHSSSGTLRRRQKYPIKHGGYVKGISVASYYHDRLLSTLKVLIFALDEVIFYSELWYILKFILKPVLIVTLEHVIRMRVVSNKTFLLPHRLFDD